MKAILEIERTREYLDYLEEHIKNVQKAWGILQEKCKDMRFIWDDSYFHEIDKEIKYHDLSKLSECEFIQYRKAFFPADGEIEDKESMASAWEHHKQNNPHHWETWTNGGGDWEKNCVHMICDWMAMGFKFGDTAQEYYEKNKDDIIIPGYAVDFMYEIFLRIGTSK